MTKNKNALKHSLLAKWGLKRNEKDARLVYSRERSDKEGWKGFVEDTYCSLVAGDKTELDEPNKLAQRLMDVATSSPAWSKVEKLSAYHHTIAAKGVYSVAKAVYHHLHQEIESHEEEPEGEDQEQGQGEEGGDGSNDGSGIASDASDSSVTLDQLMGITSALNEATEQLEKDAQAVEMLRGVGLSPDPIDGVDPIDEELINKFSYMHNLNELVDLMGGGSELTGAKAGVGVCNVVGVTQGRSLKNLIPIEKVKLIHPVLGMETKKRFMNGETFTWEVEDDAYGKGDFVLMVDRSGSMAGSRMQWARSVALSVIGKCVSEERKVVLVLFAGTSDIKTLVIKNKKDLAEAMKCLAGSARGGTDFHSALLKAREFVSKDDEKENDLLVITDTYLPHFEREDWMNGKLNCVAIGADVPKQFDGGISLSSQDAELNHAKKNQVMKSL